MACKKCPIEPVYVLQNHTSLCKQHFINYFEKKVLKNLRTYKMIEKGDMLVSALSGGKDSMTCLYLLHQYCQKQNIPIKALAIDEGIEHYRKQTLRDAATFCKTYKIPLTVLSFQKMFGFTLDSFLKDHKMNPCTACGISRRYLINRGARELGATKVATGHNLDDEAQTLLMNQFKGNVSLSAKLGPMTGALLHKQFIRRIKPLYFMTEKEVALYAVLKEFPVTFVECPNAEGAFRLQIGELLNTWEQKYPGTKQGIVNSFLEILPSLREQFKSTRQTIGTCETCGEPAAKTFCRTCELLEKIQPVKKK
ncbi:MAG TPA: TIGR00269 family protein [Candidatus Nanoarchaeia archaeon]|nr:TIGR00269 family protein [Candidatus Nanoarchaeia archaeon]